MSSAQLERKTNEVIHISNVELMNDFYHVKYEHNTNDDPHTFDLFYQYLCDGDNVLQCDITHCQAARRFFNRRHQTKPSFEDTENKEETRSTGFGTFHILCRIHTYFVHSHDVSQLSDQERKCIENKFKYIETNFESIECIDAYKIASVLSNSSINVDGNALQLIFDKNQYDMKQLMTDLCDIFTNHVTANTLLPSIIAEALHLENHDKETQHEICKSILCGGFITKTDLNHHNFIKILKISAFKVNTALNAQEIEQIASNKHLTGKIFVKNTPEFMNSNKFAKVFKEIEHGKKKQWNCIYKNIQNWTTAPPTTKIITTKNKPNSNDVNQKYHEASIDYIDIGTDVHSVQTFCTLTNATKDTAFLFLQETSWNIDIAVERYFKFDGDIGGFYDHHATNVHEANEAHFEDVIYNEGVAFRYWPKDKTSKPYIKP
eukprot:219381_1